MEVDVATNSVVFNYDFQASTFAVDCSGRRAVLAVQKWLAVVSLEQSEGANEHKPLRKLGRQNKYEIKGVLWNPHSAKHGYVISMCQQKFELWDVEAERHTLLQSVKAHTRPVSDTSWCFSDPNLLSTCSTDSFIHIWDIRETRRPSISFKAVAGATLVQWNRVNGNLIASAHDSDIRIWDRRKPSTASGYITAHTSRIHNLDWSYCTESQLTTCSHDGSIKFWDISAPRDPMDVIKAGAFPLWRARNYPSGDAVALLLVPTLHSGDSRVFLWRRNLVSPTHILTGHSEAVLELQWLDKERLATWSKDRTLRLWTISNQLNRLLGGEVEPYEREIGVENTPQLLHTSPSLTIPTTITASTTLTSTPSRGAFTSVGAEMLMSMSQESGCGEVGILLQDFSKIKLDPAVSLPIMNSFGVTDGVLPGSPLTHSLVPLPTMSPPPAIKPMFQSVGGHSLVKEFSQLRVETIPNLEIERLEASERSCTVKVRQGAQLVRVGITFPAHYPNGAAPSFMFQKNSTISINSQHELLRNLVELATSYVKQNKPCLDACLHFLVKSLESLANRPTPPKQSPDLDLYGRLDDQHIPFLRTSGARFSASGLLVCFNSPSGLTTTAVRIKTPRSLDKINTYKSRIHPVVIVPPHWSSHAFLSTSVPTRSSPGTSSVISDGGMVRGGDHGGSGSNNPFISPVVIYNATSMLPIDSNLAKVYSISGSNIKNICSQNATAAAHCGRADLVKAWSMAALVAADINLTPPPHPSIMPWPRHPFCRNLIQSLFSHFSRLHDVQMLAMLACVFQEHSNQTKEYLLRTQKVLQQQQQQQQQQTLPDCHQHRAHPSTPPLSMLHHSSLFTSSLKHSYSPPKKIGPLPVQYYPAEREHTNGGRGYAVSPISSSWQEVQMLDGAEPPLLIDLEDPVVEEQNYHETQCRLLDSAMINQCNEFRRSYTDILYSWMLLDQRAEILKYQVTKDVNSVQQRSVFVNVCRCCGLMVTGPVCKESHCYAFVCSICSLSVKGSSNLCLSCGHGGHTKHLMEWFSKYTHCPTGCGCSCLQASGLD